MRGVQISISCILLLYSQLLCVNQPWTFEVHVIKRIAVPEPDGLAEPARDLRAEVGHGALEIERAIDLHVTQGVVGAAEELHASGDDHHIELTRTAGP